ncbi:MAG: gluP 2 [Chloroflexi bacterium]|jgi:membrane associated rhomboid family serine protease|nr:gluP 2 [Chloroflexota bacterium]
MSKSPLPAAASQRPPGSLPQHRVWLTGGLALVLVGFFIWEVTVEGGRTPLDFNRNFRTATFYQVGAIYRPAIQEGQWWRLLTGSFVHANLLHLLLNGLMLLALGWRLERYLSAWRVGLIYLLTGLGAAVISFGFTLHNRDFSVGASGAIFGLGGALLGYSLRHRAVLLRQALLLSGVLGANLIVVAAVPGVDQLSHLTGLAGGLLFGFIGAAPNPPANARFPNRPLLLLSVGWLFIFGILFGFFLNSSPTA